MPIVLILLSTYNGELYLKTLIESLISQLDVQVRILVRDDGSIDNTVRILNEYKNRGLLDFYIGTNIGPSKSFMDLIYKSSNVDFYAFCDQDDLWMPNKLKIAIENINSQRPSLYFSKAEMYDKDLVLINYKKYPPRALTFGEALIRNNATGCTIVFNYKLLRILKSYKPDFIDMHDHWVYLVCLAIGGKVYYDVNSYIKYRQHGKNVVGGRITIFKDFANKVKNFINNNRSRYRLAAELKKGFYMSISVENIEILNKVLNYPKSLKNKVLLLKNSSFKTNSIFNKISLLIAIFTNRF